MAIRKVGFIDRFILRRRFRIFKKRYRSNLGHRVSLKKLRCLNLFFFEAYGFDCSYVYEVQDNQFCLLSFHPLFCEWFVLSVDGETPHLMAFDELSNIVWYATRKF